MRAILTDENKLKIWLQIELLDYFLVAIDEVITTNPFKLKA